MLKQYMYGLVAASVIALSGCATPARVNQMEVNAAPSSPLSNKLLIKNVGVGQVSGGKETSPLWASEISNENFEAALKESLQHANLYRAYPNAAYTLNATLIELRQPLVGFNMTVTSRVHYELRRKADNKALYDGVITSSYTATMSDAAIGTVRLRIADEGAARRNIQQLMTELYKLPKQAP